MDIVFSAPYGIERVSGISVFLKNLEIGLKERGYGVTILTPDRAPWIARVPQGWKDFALFAWTAFRILRIGRVSQVVHANQPHLQTLAALLAARICGYRVVVTYHLEMPPAKNRAARVIQLMSHRIISRYANMLVFVSQATKAAFPDASGVVVRIGVAEAELNQALRAAQRSDSVFTFLFAGRQTQSKGFFDVLEAVNRLRSLHVPGSFRLVLTGDTPTEEVHRKIETVDKIREVVDDRGIIPNHMLVLRTVAESDALLLPSYREGLPLIVMEAMALRCVPITTAVGGLPEIVTNGETGLVVTPGDVEGLVEAMSWALSHPSALTRIAERAATFAGENLVFERTLDAYERLYQGDTEIVVR